MLGKQCFMKGLTGWKERAKIVSREGRSELVASLMVNKVGEDAEGLEGVAMFGMASRLGCGFGNFLGQVELRSIY